MQPPDHFFIRENRSNLRIEVASIKYMEAQRNYVRIVTSERSHLVFTTLTRLEELLAGGNIIRVQRSFLINITHLTAFDREKIMMKDIIMKKG